MVREAEVDKRWSKNEGTIESKGREVTDPETPTRNRQIYGDPRAVNLTAQLLHRL